MNWKISDKKPDFWVYLLFLTMVLVTISSVLVKQSFIRVFPLYISVVISLLLSKMNRYAYLLGGINSISYGFIALYYHIPGTAISSFLFSFPLQILSFIRWSKTSWKNTTVLKKMTRQGRIWNIILLAVGWVVYFSVIRALGSASSLIDSMASLLGMYITVLQVLKYTEYTALMIPSGILTILLYISLIAQGVVEQVPFLIYSVYSLICNIRAIFTARMLLKAQQLGVA